MLVCSLLRPHSNTLACPPSNKADVLRCEDLPSPALHPAKRTTRSETTGPKELARRNARALGWLPCGRSVIPWALSGMYKRLCDGRRDRQVTPATRSISRSDGRVTDASTFDRLVWLLLLLFACDLRVTSSTPAASIDARQEPTLSTNNRFSHLDQPLPLSVTTPEIPTPSRPAVVMGLSKVGTTSITDFFKCGNVTSTHYRCNSESSQVSSVCARAFHQMCSTVVHYFLVSVV
jgi:hypothetical protein